MYMKLLARFLKNFGQIISALAITAIILVFHFVYDWRFYFLFCLLSCYYCRDTVMTSQSPRSSSDRRVSVCGGKNRHDMPS